MIVVVVMALVVGVVRVNLFDGSRHLARIDKTRQYGSSELLYTHPPIQWVYLVFPMFKVPQQ